MLRRVLLIFVAVASTGSVHQQANAQAAPSPYTWAVRYDGSGHISGQISADPDGTGPLGFGAMRASYDSAGRVEKVEKGELAAWQDENISPANWSGFTATEITNTTYDSAGNVAKVSRADGNGIVFAVTQSSFDGDNRPLCNAVRMNQGSFAALPDDACIQSPAGPNYPDRISKTIYDGFGRSAQIREGVGSSVEAAEATYSYTDNGKRRYMIDANGNRAEQVYDGHDRQTKWIFPSTTRPATYNDSTQAEALATAGSINAADYEQYSYDTAGNRTSLRKRDGSTLTYTYDALNRMTVKVVPSRAGLTAAQTRDVYYEYDLRNLMTKARFDSLAGEGITSTYNGFGELTSSSISLSGLSKTLGYAYDRESKRLELTHPDAQKFSFARDGLGRASNIYEGISQVATAQLIQNSFNNRGLLDAMQRATSPNAFRATYGYDPIGRLTSTFNDAAGTANDLTISQTYNPASQITSQARSNDAYSWTDSPPGGVNRNYTTNGLNQYTAAGSAAFAYDANGNLTSDGSTTFVYDVENRLVTASGAKTAALVYDTMGRLFETSGGAAGITRFIYDGDELAAEYNSASIMTRRYVHSDNADDPVVQYDSAAVGGSARTFLMPDERGSIAAMIRNDGTALAINTYDEYGIPGATNQGRFQYTGQAWVPELGMYHYKARIYSPTLGRFLQVDPIGYDDQVNLYAYVANDPVNKTDPEGTCGGPIQKLCLIVATRVAPLVTRLGNAIGRVIPGTAQRAQAVAQKVQQSNLAKHPQGWNSLNAAKQAQHAPQTAREGASVLTSNAKGLFEKHAGLGEAAVGTRGQVGFKERITTEGAEIGKYLSDKTNRLVPTDTAIIHYGKNGYHIVPARPSEAMQWAVPLVQ